MLGRDSQQAAVKAKLAHQIATEAEVDALENVDLTRADRCRGGGAQSSSPMG